VAVAAAIVGNTDFPTIFTGFYMTAHISCTAFLKGIQYL
jgi:hypothetical protein